MKTSKSILKVFILILISLENSSVSLKAQTKSNIPYLYYYSQEQSAFIVERADGSDHRILTQYSLTKQKPNSEVQSIISGPGWSPSGKWFVWRETTNYGGHSVGYVVSRDGKNQYSVLNELLIAQMEWSPEKDILMILVRLNDSQPFVYDVYTVDMENAKLSKHIASNVSGIKWTPDGRYLVSYVANQNKSAKMVLFTNDGSQQIRDFYQDGDGCYYPSWSHNGQVAYVDIDRKHLIVDEIGNKTQRYFDISEGAIHRIDWSPNGEYILIYTSDDCSKAKSKTLKLTFLSLNDQYTALVSSDAHLALSLSPYYNTPSFSAWSADSKHAIFLDDTNHIQSVEISTLQVHEISPVGQGFASLITWKSSEALTFVWTMTENSTQWTSDIYYYDLNTQMLEKPVAELAINLAITGNTYFAYSPSKKYLALSGLNIVDFSTNRIANIAIKDTRLNPTNNLILGNISQFLWHPNENWLITLSSQAPYLLNVVNVDGTVQRELTLCSMSQSCFGWLPDTSDLN